MQANSDFIYWAFSAAAQSIAAFVAFLLTGFALVHALMESARQRDDTLDEIHQALRKKYHRQLALLAWVTGAAIIGSLGVVFTNQWAFPQKFWLLGLVGLVDLVAIVAGLAFVVSIVNPEKYEKTATRELKENKDILKLTGTATSASSFFHAFLDLERVVRDYLRKHDLYVPSRGEPRMSYSFRQMVQALYQNERIDQGFYRDLIEVNKYRNLVFHGHLSEADQSMVDRVNAAKARIEELDRP